MKKSFIFILCAVLFTCCTKTPEQKAEALIKDSVVKHLYVPDSYQPVETQLDSAFAPYLAPELIQGVIDFHKMLNDSKDKKEDMRRAKSSMSIWYSTYHMSDYEIERYQQAKENYEEAQSSYNRIMSRLQEKAEWIKNKMAEEITFIGFMARHRFRANNNAGDTLFGESYYLLNPELTTIVAEWDEDDINMFFKTFEQEELQEFYH